MRETKKHYLHKCQAKIKNKNFNQRLLVFKNKKRLGKKIVSWLDEINLLFSYILSTKGKQYFKYAPYKVTVSEMVMDDEFKEKAVYWAVNKGDGTLDLSLNFSELNKFDKIPVEKMVWMFFHEFRHKIQKYDVDINSVIRFPNWKNFNSYMQKKFKKSEDFINHIFHELNPDEVDANIFASQMTEVKFNGCAFDITEQTLKLLTKK